MKLSLDLFGVEVLEQVRLKIEAWEGFEMMGNAWWIEFTQISLIDIIRTAEDMAASKR